MKMCNCFELVNVAEEHLVIPLGEKAESFKGLVVLNDAAAFLLSEMQKNQSTDELVSILTEHYKVDEIKALEDITKMLNTLQMMGIVVDE